jgi:hypothetical protein
MSHERSDREAADAAPRYGPGFVGGPRTWTVPHATLYIASAIALGLLLDMIGALLIYYGVAHGTIVFIVGLAPLAFGVMLLLVPANIVSTETGTTFTVSSRTRSLVIAPGELRRIACVWIDPGRLLPMRLTATQGTIFLSPRFKGTLAMFEALQNANPHALITTPTPWTYR